MYTPHTYCRACGYAAPATPNAKLSNPEKLLCAFDLGLQPLANDFAKAGDECAGYAPLKVLFCPRCTLGQLSVVVRPDILYSRYLYVTSQSETMRRHFDALEAAILQETKFASLLEIGSNDGALLKHFAAKGIKVAGIDPAENLTDSARKFGIPSITGTFNAQTAQLATAACRDGFDIILARHVFCHVDNWREFVDCLAIPSHQNTLVCIEVPYVKDLLERGEFDTIYHEHLSYLSVRAMRALLADSPFRLQRIVRFPIHGGAIVLMLRRNDFVGVADASVGTFEEEEKITEESWKSFSMKATDNIEELTGFVMKARADKARVAGMGASAKSTVWINACKFRRSEIEFVTDTTPQKLYRTIPGSDIPIVDEGAILRELPDYLVVFCWNYLDECIQKNKRYLEKGGKLVVPVPSIRVISNNG